MSIHDKAAIVRELIATAPVKILVNTGLPDVVVPKSQRDKQPLVLNIGHFATNPIADLDIHDAGISGTLSFDPKPEWCFIPWAALQGLMQDDGVQILWEPVTEPGQEPKHGGLQVVK